MRRKLVVIGGIATQGVLVGLFLFRSWLFRVGNQDFSVAIALLLLSLLVVILQAVFTKRLRVLEPMSWIGLILPLLFQIGFYSFIFHITAHPFVMVILGIAYCILLLPLERGMQELRGYSALPFRSSRIALNTTTLITGFFFAYLFIVLPYDILFKLIVAVVMFFLLFLQCLLWWTKRQGIFSLYFSLIISVIVVETLWVLQFLPHTPFVVTLIFLSLLHLLIGLVHNYSKGQLTLRLVGEYFSITVLICFLVLATSQWFPLYTQ